MTAEAAGKVAVDSVWGTLRRLKEQWVMLVFLTGALLWVRDTYGQFANLPELVRRQMDGFAALETTVTRLEAELVRRLDMEQGPVFAFPGSRHSVDDRVPGAWTVLRWSPVQRRREDCVPTRVDAYMVDRSGQWFSVGTALAPMPSVEGETELAFGVQIDSRMSRGRVRVGLQITSDCGARRQVQLTPWLQFRVLDG